MDFFEQVVRERFTIPGITRLLVALRFYAVGCFLLPLGDMFGISKSSACDIITEVSYLIASKLRDRYIRAPATEVDILNAKAAFHRIGNHPLIIAGIDGTQVKVRSFGGDDAELYRNRKTFFSLNCQIAVSADVSRIRHSIYSKLNSAVIESKNFT